MESRKLGLNNLKKLLSSTYRYNTITPFVWNLLSITIDSTKIQDITIDGSQAQEVTIDGNTVWTAGPNVNEITTDVTLNGQSIDLTIYEDTNNDGTADNTETITVGDGTNTYSLSNLDGSSGNDYWIEWQLSNSDVTKTAKANYADLKDVGTWNSSSEWDNRQSQTGVVHENTSNTDHNDATVIKKGYSASSPLYSSDLEGYWPLHEDSGSTAYDVSGSSSDGSIGSGVTPGSTGLLGSTSYHFDGSSDSHMTVSSTVIPTSSSFTVSWWGKFLSGNDSSDECYFSQDTDNNRNTIRIKNYGTEFIVQDSNKNYLKLANDDVIRDDDKWHHVVVIYDGSQYIGYVDSSKVGSASSSNGFSSGYLHVGWSGNSNKNFEHYGNFTELRVYNRALSSSEIQSLYDLVSTQGTLTSNTKSS